MLVDVMRPLLLGYSMLIFLFSGSCFVLKPLKLRFLISCFCRIKYSTKTDEISEGTR